MSFGEKFGDLIKSRRTELGLTIEELAERAWGSGDRKSDISRIEQGKVGEPRAKTVATLAEALAITQTELQALRKEMRDVNRADDPDEDDAGSLKAEPPKIIKHIRWFLDHGTSNKLVVLIACILVTAPALYAFKDEIFKLCCSTGIGEFSITFSNRSLETTRISQTAEFYITEPESPGVNARVSSGLLRFEAESAPFIVHSGQERLVVGHVVNEEKIRNYVLEGDKFISVIFSASPKPVRNEFILNQELFAQGLKFEISKPDIVDVAQADDRTDVSMPHLPQDKSEFESIDVELAVQISRTGGFAGYDKELDTLKKNFPECTFDIPDPVNIEKFSKSFCEIRKTFFSTMVLGKASDFIVSMEWEGDEPAPTVVKRFAMTYGADRAEEFYDFIVQSTQAAKPRSVFCLPGHLKAYAYVKDIKDQTVKAYSITVEDIYDVCLDRNQN